MILRALLAVLVVLVPSVLPAQAETIWLKREDVAGKAELRWKGLDGVRRSSTDSRAASLQTGQSDALAVCVQAIPSEGDNTVASYCSSYRRRASNIEAMVNGAIVEDNYPLVPFYKDELGFVVTFRVEGHGVFLAMHQHRAGTIGAVDFILYNHTQQQVIAQVVNNRTVADFGQFSLLDGEVYSLAVRLSSSGSTGFEYGFEADFNSTSGTSPQIQPEAP